MVTEALLGLLFDLVKFIITLLPDALFELPEYAVDFISMVSKGLFFFPADLFYVCIGNILCWLGIQFGWAFIEWVYKKFPGVD